MAVQSSYPAEGSKIFSSWLQWAGIILAIWLAVSIVAGVIFGLVVNYGKRREARRRAMFGHVHDEHQPIEAPVQEDAAGPQASQNSSEK